MIYVLQVLSGCESKARAALSRKGITAYVPRRELIIRRGGGWSKTVNVLFSGYVFVECDFSPEIFYKVKTTGDVIRWLGKPTPIPPLEEQFLRLLINGGVPIPESSAETDSSGNVTVTGG